MVRYILFAFISLLSSILPVLAQEKNLMLKRLNSDDGLSDSRITCVLKDPSGFIWVGTKDGLNRYDGREFTIFKNIENDTASLCGNRITCLAYDSDSILWIGTASSGFSSYNFRTGKFRSYTKSNSPLYSNSINAFVFDRKNNKLWVGLYNYGLQFVDLKTKKLETDSSIIFFETTIFDLAEKGNTILVAPMAYSLKKLDHGAAKELPAYQKGRNINKIFIDHENKTWCGAWDNALHEFNNNNQLITSYIFDGSDKINLSNDEILSLAEDKNGILWCGTKYTGIHFFDLKRKFFLQNYNLSEKINSRVNCVYKDDFDRIWIGSENGLFIYDPLYNQFEAIKMPVPEGIGTCKVFGRAVTKGGKEFIISACGLFYKREREDKYSYREITYLGEKQQLISINSDFRGRIFIGTQKTIFELDTITLEFHLIRSNNANQRRGFYSVTASRINDIVPIRYKGDSLLAASLYGYYVSLIDYKRQNIFELKAVKYRDHDWSESLTRKLFIDSKNNFWVCGAAKGICEIKIQDSVKFSNFPFSDTCIRTIPYHLKTWANKKSGPINAVNDVFDIAENQDGSYWLSTQGYGLIKFFPANDTLPFVSYSGDYKSLHGIIKSDENNIWLISSKGLLHYNVKDNWYKLYNKKNGISETIGGYFFQVPSSEINVGFDGGFFSFNPNSILSDSEKPILKVTHLWIMDMASDSLLFSPLHLTHDRNFLKFYLSANCFSNNDQINYLYFLEGIDKGWRSNQSSPFITYTNLPHGNFNLKVKAINSDGIESDMMIFPFIISPPFYKTSWFYISSIVLLVTGAYTFYRYRIRQILKLQEVRNKIARDLHDDIGSTLGSINLYSQIASSKLKTEKQHDIKNILEKIGSSSREIIDKTGDAVWAVKASNDTLKNLILRMESYAASLLGTAGIAFTIEYDQRMDNIKLEMTQRKNIFLIYKEAIHNIIKYAGCTEASILIKKSGDKLRIIISDNGKGIISNGTNPYNGNGIKNMKFRAEEINGSFHIKSEENKGTAIEIIV